ncbi:MAG: DUF1045 domain-containing protein [Pseudomonadota bacterium]
MTGEPAPGGYARYALYWMPRPGTPMAEAGAAWLGWDPATGAEDKARAADPRVAAPRRYGLHATLKAPFALAPGGDAAGLQAALAAFAAATPPAEGPRLALTGALGFLALMPDGPCPAIDALADACVERFDRFRAPLSDAERARRGAERMDPATRARFERWGYPYVKEGFRLHITLTGRLEASARAAAEAELKARFGPLLGTPFAVDALALVGDPGGGQAFRLIRHYTLTG